MEIGDRWRRKGEKKRKREGGAGAAFIVRFWRGESSFDVSLEPTSSIQSQGQLAPWPNINYHDNYGVPQGFKSLFEFLWVVVLIAEMKELVTLQHELLALGLLV